MASAGLLHPQVNVGYDAVEGKVWPEPPPDDHLHVFVGLPRGVGHPGILCERFFFFL